MGRAASAESKNAEKLATLSGQHDRFVGTEEVPALCLGNFLTDVEAMDVAMLWKSG